MAYTIIRVDGINTNRIATCSNFSSGNRQTREGLNIMLWDLIRDFFVQHVFGGMLSNNTWVSGKLGYVNVFLNGEWDDSYLVDTTDVFYPIGIDSGGIQLNLSLADWLSTTATAISITIIVVLCCLFIYKIIKLIGGLIR